MKYLYLIFDNSNMCIYSYLFGFIKNNFSTIRESWVCEIKLINEIKHFFSHGFFFFFWDYI